jgi:hypothetical protein
MQSKEMSRKFERYARKLNPNCCVNKNKKVEDARGVHQKHECNILILITGTG